MESEVELVKNTYMPGMRVRLIQMVKAESAAEESTGVPKSAEENADERVKMILEFCSIPRSRDEIMSHIGLVI